MAEASIIPLSSCSCRKTGEHLEVQIFGKHSCIKVYVINGNIASIKVAENSNMRDSNNYSVRGNNIVYDA